MSLLASTGYMKKQPCRSKFVMATFLSLAVRDAGSFSCGRSRKRIFCPHCDENVTYYRHRAQFFDFRTDQWMKASRGDSPSLNDSTSSDDDREQFFTRALNQPKPLGDYENGSSQTGRCILPIL